MKAEKEKVNIEEGNEFEKLQKETVKAELDMKKFVFGKVKTLLENVNVVNNEEQLRNVKAVTELLNSIMKD